jgi:hypothetical protein
MVEKVEKYERNGGGWLIVPLLALNCAVGNDLVDLLQSGE